MEREKQRQRSSPLFGGRNYSIPCRASCYASVDLEEKVAFILHVALDLFTIHWFKPPPPPPLYQPTTLEVPFYSYVKVYGGACVIVSFVDSALETLVFRSIKTEVLNFPIVDDACILEE